MVRMLPASGFKKCDLLYDIVGSIRLEHIIVYGIPGRPCDKAEVCQSASSTSCDVSLLMNFLLSNRFRLSMYNE
jgi:hypothetical protein